MSGSMYALGVLGGFLVPPLVYFAIKLWPHRWRRRGRPGNISFTVERSGVVPASANKLDGT